MNFAKLSSKVPRAFNIGGMSGGMKMVKRLSHVGVPGSGVGKGGGGGGAVKQSGGGLGKMAAAREEGYFYDKQQKQLRDLKSKMDLNKKLEDAPAEKKTK